MYTNGWSSMSCHESATHMRVGTPPFGTDAEAPFSLSAVLFLYLDLQFFNQLSYWGNMN